MTCCYVELAVSSLAVAEESSPVVTVPTYLYIRREGWPDGDSLHTEVVCPPERGYPSQQ